jgi:hypothetical protein
MAGLDYSAKRAHEDARKTPLERALEAIERAAKMGLVNWALGYHDELIAGLVLMQLSERGFQCKVVDTHGANEFPFVLEVAW